MRGAIMFALFPVFFGWFTICRIFDLDNARDFTYDDIYDEWALYVYENRFPS